MSGGRRWTLALAAVLVATGDLRGRARLGGYAAGALLLGLSLDELASLHERAPQGAQLLALAPFALAGGVTLLFTLASWFPHRATRPSAVLLALGFACFGSVVGQGDPRARGDLARLGDRPPYRRRGGDRARRHLPVPARGAAPARPGLRGPPRTHPVPRRRRPASAGDRGVRARAARRRRLRRPPPRRLPEPRQPGDVVPDGRLRTGRGDARRAAAAGRAGRTPVALGLVAVFALLSAVHAVFNLPPRASSTSSSGATSREPVRASSRCCSPAAGLRPVLAIPPAAARRAGRVPRERLRGDRLPRGRGERVGGARPPAARSRPDRPGARRDSPSREAPGPRAAPEPAPGSAAQGPLRAARCGRR